MRLAVAVLAALLVAQSSALAARRQVLYGHITSLTRKAGRYELKFDPAWWLTGSAAAQAKFEDTGSKDVPNDYYIVEEGHRLLTYAVASGARVTVLTRNGATRVTVAELAQIVAGRNPNHRELLEPKAGFWIQVGSKDPSPVVSLEQQYQP
jgi:hypothetical protein